MRTLLLSALACALAAAPARGQADGELPAVARFPIAASPIGLISDVRPGAYLGITGPRSAWLGLETGPAELWVHPLEIASDFQLHFQTPLYRDPVRAIDVAERIEVRPELTTITYTHATFTVRQHILAPQDEPALLILLDVESIAPLEMVVQFRPVLQYMWPAAFGGQYLFWDARSTGFLLSESLRRRNAVIGTSWPARGESLPAHRLADAPATMVIPVDSARARREFIPIVIAAGTLSRDSLFTVYRRVLANARALYDERRAWADSVLETTTSIDSPDDSLDLAFAWAKVNLEEQRVCNPDLGCGLVAGWGISGSSSRPGFGWYFGGDAAINSLAMDATGQWQLVAEDLRFLARNQREDGKIPHEISQAAAHIDWFGAYPYAYYHADTTPYWMLALWEYWRASGDDSTLRELWPAFRKAFAWCLTVETDDDGIIENTTGGLGAIEVGGLGESLHQDIYLAAVWTRALEGTIELARRLDEDELERQASGLYEKARSTLNEAYWRAGEDQHAFAILTGGRTNDNLTAWPGTAASFRLLDEERAVRTLRKLATDSVSADWGARLLSIGSSLYDPLHYNNGAVWPFMTGFVAWGQYAYRRPWAGFHLIDAVKQITFDWSRGRHPENFSGAFYRTLDETVPHQFFASSMMITPVMRGVLGWQPDAPALRAQLSPQLPPSWRGMRVEHLRVGASDLSVEIVQEPMRIGTHVSATGPAIELELTLAIPAGARDVRVTLDGADASGVQVTEDRYGSRAVVSFSTGSAHDVSVTWTGGLAVEPPHIELKPGQQSEGLRIVDFVREGDAWSLTLDGLRGRRYTVHLFGQRVRTSDGGVEWDEELERNALDVGFPEGTGRTILVVRVR